MRWTVSRLLMLVLVSSGCSESQLPVQPAPDPSPLVAFMGVISDSETNTPLEGVIVCLGLGPNCARTGSDGAYHLTVPRGAVSGGANQSTCLPFAFLEGYEGRGGCVQLIGNRLSWSVTLQRTITLDAGRTLRSTVFRGEGSGVLDWGLCDSCKSFNVLVPGSGTLFVSAVADSPGTILQIQMFIPGFENGAVRITNERVAQVVVHAAAVPASFELITSFRSGS